MTTTTTDTTTTARCEACGYHYVNGPAEDDYRSCPRCNPGQPRPLRERLTDPTCFMGTGYIWNPCRGVGAWEPIGECVLVPIQDLRDLAALFPEASFDRPVFDVVRDEVRRLRGADAVPVNATTRPRYDELADRCQRLDDDLRRKRAQCDELRDEVERLRAERGRRS